MSLESSRSLAFDPLSEGVLARTIRQELESRPLQRLMPERFVGAGLYALYYSGEFSLYEGINDLSLNIPVYVGKAQAKSSRMGRVSEGSNPDKLWRRIEKHANSISAAENLELCDFRVRYLIMRDVMIALGELGLLHEYAPIWNHYLDGLGSNVHGAGRSQQQMSKWETTHPGRSRTARPNPRSADEIASTARAHIDHVLNTRLGAREWSDLFSQLGIEI